MLFKEFSRECKCQRLPATWLCAFEKCKDPFFCKKCRKNHEKTHEEFFYPIRELLEEDTDSVIDQFELTRKEKEDLYSEIDRNIEHAQDQFERQMKAVRKALRKNVDDFHLRKSLNFNLGGMQDIRKKVLKDPYDNDLLRELGTQYHR
jgi:hypothetical protein